MSIFNNLDFLSKSRDKNDNNERILDNDDVCSNGDDDEDEQDYREQQPKNGNRKLSTTSVVSMETLPERVSELFMLDDAFFRSPFMRHKMPNLLFSNGKNLNGNLLNFVGTAGLEPIFASSSSSGDTLRSRSPVSYYHHNPPNQDRSENNRTPFNDSYNQSDSDNNRKQNDVVIRNIPIKIVDRHTNNTPQPSKTHQTSSPSTQNPLNTPQFIPDSRKNVQYLLESDDDADSLSLRSAPPEFWQMGRDFGSSVGTPPTGAVEKLAWRKMSTSKDPNVDNGGSLRNRNWPPEPATSTSMTTRLFTPNRNGRKSPAVGPISSKGGLTTDSVNFRSMQNHFNNSRQNSFGNGVNLDYRNNNNFQQQRSRTPTFISTSSAPINQPYSVIPFRGETPRISSALSTPSLFSESANSNAQFRSNSSQNNNNQEDVKTNLESKDPSYSFLRRTQTAYTIPPNHLPRRDSEPSIVIESTQSNKHGSTASTNHLNGTSSTSRHSLHESLINSQEAQKKNLSSVRMEPQLNNSSKSPSLVSLIFRSNAKSTVNANPAPATAPKPTAIKRTTFAPLSCVRKNLGSDDEEQRISMNKTNSISNLDSEAAKSLRSRSPSLNKSSLRLTEFLPRLNPQQSQTLESQNIDKIIDPVEEAIRSLESFDPNDYIVQSNNQLATSPPEPSATNNDNTSENDALPPPPPTTQPPSESIISNKILTSLPGKTSEQRDSIVSSSSYASSGGESATTTSSNNTTTDTQSLAESEINTKRIFINPVDWRKNSVQSSSESATPTGSILDLGNSGRGFENRTPTNMGNFHASNNNNMSTGLKNPTSEFYANYQQQQQTNPRSNHAAEVDQMIARLQNNSHNFDRRQPTQSPSANRQYQFNGGSPQDLSPDYEDESLAAAEAEVHLRKRFLCTQLTDCSKVIEINSMKINQFAGTSPGWRNAQILRHNLSAIRDTVYTIEFALDELLEALTRISLNRQDSRYEQYYQLSMPLHNSQALIKRLRDNLDSTGWSLSALAKNSNSPSQNDSLDQFVAILKQLPRDCYKLVQWIYQLGVWNEQRNDASAIFLSNTTPTVSTGLPPPPASMSTQAPERPQKPQALIRQQQQRMANNSTPNTRRNFVEQQKMPISPLYANTNGVTFNFDNQQSQKNNSQNVGNQMTTINKSLQTTPKKANEVKPNLSSENPKSPTSTEEMLAMDGGESTTSSTSSTATPQPLEELGKRGARILSESEDGDNDDARMVYEEDDLMSVASESVDSLYGDYSSANGSSNQQQTRNNQFVRPKTNRGVIKHGSYSAASLQRHNSNAQQHQQMLANQKIHRDLLKRISVDERELIQFYQPQVEAHIEELCRLIEEFFNVVEEQHMQAAKIYVQKIQMICIKAQTLVCIARMVSKDDCITTKQLQSFLDVEANRLDSLLNECISNAKVAKDLTQSVPAVQAMVSSVVGVSQTALNLKLFWKSCCI